MRASNFALQICQIDALAVAWMLVGCRGPGTRGTCRNGVTVEAAARSSNGSGSIAERASRLAPGSGLAPRGEQGRPDQLVRRGLGELVPYGLRRAEVSMRGAVAGCSLGQLGAFVQQRIRHGYRRQRRRGALLGALRRFLRPYIGPPGPNLASSA